ncbi:hypothetical protein [Tellurirhabdus rosea]|uniref:hypothetical protein n=1 Tax=Tellurirhabdus rosea TaxID=2674997 RepID=UPI0022576955|nr:hypothetical protein [Tellurirhabdus rosea]
MMTQYEYNLLPITKKAELLWQEGTYLLTRQASPFEVRLYALGDFFVEAYFTASPLHPGGYEFQDVLTFRKQDLSRIRRPHPLEPYIDQVDLRMLIGA